MCHLTWQAPVWDSLTYKKHVRANRKNWERSFTTAMTGERNQPAQYDPNIPVSEIRDMELSCLGRDGRLIQDRCHKRTYWRCMDRIIGASAGEQTQYIFVEYVNSGHVHGRPIAASELDEKLRRAANDDPA